MRDIGVTGVQACALPISAFMNRENSLLVDYELVTIEQTRALYRAGYRWAEPSVEHAAKLMRQGFEDRKSVGEGKSVDLGGRRIIKKKNRITHACGSCALR